MEFEKDEFGYPLVGDKYKYPINAYELIKYDYSVLESIGLKNEDKYYDIVIKIVSLLKTEGLTVRQAQHVLDGCKEAVLDMVNMD